MNDYDKRFKALAKEEKLINGMLIWFALCFFLGWLFATMYYNLVV